MKGENQEEAGQTAESQRRYNRRMGYRYLADAVVFLHLAWIVFLVLGVFPGRKIRAVRALHIGGLAFALIIQLSGWYCPLTYLEQWLRAKAGPAPAYGGSFIVHYLEKIIYVELPRDSILLCTVLLIGMQGWLYSRKKTAG